MCSAGTAFRNAVWPLEDRPRHEGETRQTLDVGRPGDDRLVGHRGRRRGLACRAEEETAHGGPPNTGLFRNAPFRECPELGAADGGNGRTAALRCFANDGSGLLVAELYPSDVADHEDHRAHAEPLTTEADAALARERAHAGGRRTADQVGALIGIALERLSVARAATPPCASR